MSKVDFGDTKAQSISENVIFPGPYGPPWSFLNS